MLSPEVLSHWRVKPDFISKPSENAVTSRINSEKKQGTKVELR